MDSRKSGSISPTLLKESLTSLYDATTALIHQPTDKHYGASDALASRFNELLKQAKALYPDQVSVTWIREIVLVKPDVLIPAYVPRLEARLHEVKLMVLQLAHVIDDLFK